MSVINAVLPDDLKSTGIQQWFFGISPLRTEISPDSLFLILHTADGMLSKVFTILWWNSETHTMMVFVHPIMLLTLYQLTYLAVTFSFSYFLVAITYLAFCVPRFLTNVACHQLEHDLMFFMNTSVFYCKQNISLWDMLIYKNPVIFINHRMLFLFTFGTVSQPFICHNKFQKQEQIWLL